MGGAGALCGGTAPPPGTPFDFTVGLLQNGAVELRWKCNNPSGTSGTIYEVLRRIGAGGSGTGFTFIGASGTRSFIDETLPNGAHPVTYQITAVRSTTRGYPAQFTINFGVGGGGAFTITGITAEPAEMVPASVREAAGARIAA